MPNLGTLELGAMDSEKPGALGLALIWGCLFAASIAELYAPSVQSELGQMFLLIIGVVLLSKKKTQTRAIDWSVLSIAVIEIASLGFWSYRANGIGLGRAIVLVLVVFLAVRLIFRSSIQIVCFATILGIGDALLGLDGLRQFAAEASRLTDAGFSNLLAFRSRLIAPPAPWIAGEWFTVVLLGLPFACAVPIYLWREGKLWSATAALLLPLLVTATLTLSLSRAVFWSTVLVYLSACALMIGSRVVSLRTGGLLLAGALSALVLILACESVVYPGITKTYAGQHASQIRSTQGRLEIWNRSMELVRAHPLLGVGSSNAALMLLSSTDDEETTGFASRTFSLPVQILVEKGILGFLLYIVFLALVAREFVRTMRYSPPLPNSGKNSCKQNYTNGKTTAGSETKDESAYKAMVCCFAAGLSAVLFRELTYSSLMDHSLTMALFAALAALVCRPETPDGNP